MSDSSQRRRYLGLLARARRHPDTPEGKLCAKMADAMLRKRPELADADPDVLPRRFVEYRYKTEHEHELLIRIGRYLELDPKRWTGSRAKVVLFEADEPTHAAIDQSFEQLRGRLHDVVVYAIAGFFHGSLPLPNSGERDEDSDRPDQALLDTAMAAMEHGRGAPVRKALK